MTKNLLYFFLALFILSGCTIPAVSPTAPAVESPTLSSPPISTATATPTSEPTATLEPTQIPLPEVMLNMGLPPEDFKNFSVEDDKVFDNRDHSVAMEKNENGEWVIVSIRYGPGWEVIDGKMQVKDVSLDELNCVKEGKSCVTEKIGEITKAPVFKVDCVSTGAFDIRPLYNTDNNEYLGMAYNVWVETMGQNKNKSMFPVSFQVMTSSGENSVYMVLSFVNSQNSKYISIKPNDVTTPKDLIDILYTGNIFRLNFSKDSKSLSKTHLNTNFWEKVYSDSYLMKMINYFESLISSKDELSDPEITMVPTNYDYPNSK